MANEHETHGHEEHHAGASTTTTATAHQDKNPMAFLAYLWVLILIPFLTPAKDDPFVKYHLKQGLMLIIFEIIGWFLNYILVWIPFIGWLIMWLWWIASLVLVIIGLMNVGKGEEKELPFIGHYAKSFTF
jgi:uncharacterized membrane protein